MIEKEIANFHLLEFGRSNIEREIERRKYNIYLATAREIEEEIANQLEVTSNLNPRHLVVKGADGRPSQQQLIKIDNKSSEK